MKRTQLANTNFYSIQQALDRLRSILAAVGKVKVSAFDIVADYLGVKLSGSPNVSLTVVNPGGNEQLRVDGTGLTVANLAALGAVDPAVYNTGIECYVEPLKQAFVYEPLGTLVPDGITVIAAIGGGIWTRRTDSVIDWQRQATWFINALTGNDENDGATTGTAIKTWAEYVRRVGLPIAPRQGTTVTIETDLPIADPLTLDFIAGYDPYRIHGDPTVTSSSTVASFTDNHAANQPCLLSIVGFDALGNVGTFLRFTDAFAPGQHAWASVQADLGNGAGGIFQCSTPVADAFFGGNYTPLPADPVDVCTLPTVVLLDARMSTTDSVTVDFSFVVRNLRLIPSTAFPFTASTIFGGSWFECAFVNCRMGLTLVHGACFFQGCYADTLSGDGTMWFQSGVVKSLGAYETSVNGFGFPVLQNCVAVESSLTFYGLGFYADPGRGMELYDGSVLSIRALPWFGDFGGVSGPRCWSGSQVQYDGALATQIVFINPSSFSIGGFDFFFAPSVEVPYVASDSSGVSPFKQIASAYRRSLEAGVKGTPPAGNSFALTDLTSSATETPTVITSTGILKNLRVFVGTPGGVVTATMLVDGVATAVTCATASGGSTASYTGTGIKVTAGQRVSFRINSSLGTAANISLSAEAT